MSVVFQPFSFDRVERAVAKVQERMRRAVAALEGANIPYAVAGGNAVASWVARVDEEAVRTTRDVDILLRRDDLPAATAALEAAGFLYRHVAGIDVFLDGPDAKASAGVHVVFAGEKVRENEPAANPDVTDSVPADDLRVLSLEALVCVKLTAYRDKDRTHLRDMIRVGLIDATWPARLPPTLGERLQVLLDDPDG